MVIVPPEISSNPAIIRKAVDLPHPEGPTSTINSWSLISRFSPSITDTLPKRLSTFWKTTSAIYSSLLLQSECHWRLGHRHFQKWHKWRIGGQLVLESSVLSVSALLWRRPTSRCYHLYGPDQDCSMRPISVTVPTRTAGWCSGSRDCFRGLPQRLRYLWWKDPAVERRADRPLWK